MPAVEGSGKKKKWGRQTQYLISLTAKERTIFQYRHDDDDDDDDDGRREEMGRAAAGGGAAAVMKVGR